MPIYKNKGLFFPFLDNFIPQILPGRQNDTHSSLIFFKYMILNAVWHRRTRCGHSDVHFSQIPTTEYLMSKRVVTRRAGKKTTIN